MKLRYTLAKMRVAVDFAQVSLIRGKNTGKASINLQSSSCATYTFKDIQNLI
jgi:hypothetical protein